MKLREKLIFSVLGLSIFIVSGGLACSYDDAAIVGQVLAVVMGVLVFITVGAAACIYSSNKVARQTIQNKAKPNIEE